MQRVITVVFWLALIGGAVFALTTHKEQVLQVGRQLQARFLPCESPISYSIGSIDTRFGISTTTFVANMKAAEAIWEKNSDKDLFEYATTSGDVTVNLVYDERQAATDKLQAAGIQIDKSRSSYDSLKAQYDSVSARVQQEKAAFARDVAAYKKREAAYNAQVQSWNRKGGAPPEVYQQLQQEKAALQEQLKAVNAAQAQLNADVDTANALATTLNQLIVQLNLNVKQYNQTGAAQGEFEEGLYESSAGVRKIDIYEYSNRTELVRVLAHELGHALGLSHVADAAAIMYKVNQGKSLALTTDDVAELDRVCSAGPL